MAPESGRSSGVEHNLAKVGVEGSNPFARSKISNIINDFPSVLKDAFGIVVHWSTPGQHHEYRVGQWSVSQNQVGKAFP